MTSFAELTTTRVGGPARTVLEARSRDELITLASQHWADDHVLILGEGSNTVVGDDGFSGTVILVRSHGIDIIAEDPRTVDVRIQAGHDWDAFVAWAVEQGLAGVEGMSGIPGTVGAAPIQNIGAYGQEIEDVMLGLEFLDEGTSQPVYLPTAELGFAFRTSVFKRGRRGVILSVDLRLTRSSDGLSEPVAYDQLANALGVQLGTAVPLADARAKVLALRGAKGMLVSDDPDSHSTGSFFMNPIVRASFARDLPPEAPRYPVDQEETGLVKLSAAWLIENAGIPKGFRLSGSRAAVSHKHSLALTNQGGATANEILELARFIQLVVQSNFGLMLQPEANLINAEL
jgi:UDP-N-acetylmuramate dehydrogenase